MISFLEEVNVRADVESLGDLSQENCLHRIAFFCPGRLESSGIGAWFLTVDPLEVRISTKPLIDKSTLWKLLCCTSFLKILRDGMSHSDNLAEYRHHSYLDTVS